MLLQTVLLAFQRMWDFLLMASEEGVMLLVKAQGNPNLSFIILLSIGVRTALLSLAQLKQNNNNNNIIIIIIIIIIMIRIKTKHKLEAPRRCQPCQTLAIRYTKKI